MNTDAAFLTPEYAYLELRELGLLEEIEARVMCGMRPGAIGRAWHSHRDVTKRPYAVAAELAARFISSQETG